MRKVTIRRNIVIALVFLLLASAATAYFWKDVFPEKKEIPKSSFDVEKLRKDYVFTESPTIVAEIDSFMQFIAKKRIFSGSILVAVGDSILYKNAFGWADLEDKKRIKNKTYTSFRLASVSKTLTATGVLRLVDKGKLRLNDTVSHILPKFPYDTIEVKHLLSHTSGLKDYINEEEYLWNWDKEDTLSNQDVLDLIAKKKLELNFEPGTDYSYSNSGYAMLALIIEEVSKMSFEEYMYKYIFRPLRMYNSMVYNKLYDDSLSDSTIKHRAYGYYRYGNTYMIHDNGYRSCVYGDKAIYSSVEDLFKFHQAMEKGRVLSPKMRKLAYQKTRIKGTKDSIEYGLGWRTSKINGKKYVFHNGYWRAFKTSYYRFLDEKITIIALSNNANNIVYKLPWIFYAYLKFKKKSAPEVIQNLAQSGKIQEAVDIYSNLKTKKANQYYFSPGEIENICLKMTVLGDGKDAKTLLTCNNDTCIQNFSLFLTACKLDTLTNYECKKQTKEKNSGVLLFNQTGAKKKIYTFYNDTTIMLQKVVNPYQEFYAKTDSDEPIIVSDMKNNFHQAFFAELKPIIAIINDEQKSEKKLQLKDSYRIVVSPDFDD